VVAATIVAVGVAVALLTVAGVAPWTTGSYKLTVVLPTAGSLGPDAGVRIAGLQVGKVTSVERMGTMARFHLSIDQAKVPLPEDTRAALRLRSLVGENYVELTPGSSRHGLKSGSTLPLTQDDRYEEADEVLSVLRGPARANARRMIQELGGGLDGQGPKLNSFLHHGGGAVRNAADVAAVLANDHRQVAGLVEHVGDIMREIGDRQTSVKQLARSGRTTFQALADRESAIKRVLAQLPPTLTQVRSISAALTSVSASTAPVVTDLAAAVDELRPAVHALRPAARAGGNLLDALSASAPGLESTLGRLRAASAPTVAALPQVGAVLCQLNPMIRYLVPYSQDLMALVENMASATNFYDATGHAARLYAVVGQQSVAAINPTEKAAIDQLLNLGVLGRLQRQGYNPYGRAGTGNHPTGGEGRSGPSDRAVPYPRVTADC
jgi:virulence factor Mce-like protein